MFPPPLPPLHSLPLSLFFSLPPCPLLICLLPQAGLLFLSLCSPGLRRSFPPKVVLPFPPLLLVIYPHLRFISPVTFLEYIQFFPLLPCRCSLPPFLSSPPFSLPSPLYLPSPLHCLFVPSYISNLSPSIPPSLSHFRLGKAFASPSLRVPHSVILDIKQFFYRSRPLMLLLLACSAPISCSTAVPPESCTTRSGWFTELSIRFGDTRSHIELLLSSSPARSDQFRLKLQAQHVRGLGRRDGFVRHRLIRVVRLVTNSLSLVVFFLCRFQSPRQGRLQSNLWLLPTAKEQRGE